VSEAAGKRGSLSRGLRVVLAGATGALGREVRAALESSALPIAKLIPVATEGSIGEEIEFRGEELFVETELPALRGIDLVVLCTPASVSLELIREALRAGVPCIDCSGALGASREVPLVMSDRSGAAELTAPVLGTPSGVALAWARALGALSERAGIERVVGTVMQPAAHAGRRGIEILSAETIALLSQTEAPVSDVFPGPVAFDCLTATGDDTPGGGTPFETRVRDELRRLLGDGLEVAVTSVQVPTFVGEGSTLAVQTARPLSVEAAAEVLSKAAGVELWGAEEGAPSTRETAGRDQVLVGRLRRDPSHERGLLLWLASDGLRLVAAEVTRLAETRLRLN
jgi:aspartate-semialdehyde dehydrogenase